MFGDRAKAENKRRYREVFDGLLKYHPAGIRSIHVDYPDARDGYKNPGVQRDGPERIALWMAGRVLVTILGKQKPAQLQLIWGDLQSTDWTMIEAMVGIDRGLGVVPPVLPGMTGGGFFIACSIEVARALVKEGRLPANEVEDFTREIVRAASGMTHDERMKVKAGEILEKLIPNFNDPDPDDEDVETDGEREKKIVEDENGVEY